MKERALEILKELIPMQDAYEELSLDEREQCDAMDTEYKLIRSKLTKEDSDWLDDQFRIWYEKKLHVETTLFVKPRTG